MKVKVYEQGDGTVRVLHPNPKMRLEGETDDEFVDRIAALSEQHDPSLGRAKSKRNVAADSLPPRARRHAWRIKAGKLVDDKSVADPVEVN